MYFLYQNAHLIGVEKAKRLTWLRHEKVALLSSIFRNFFRLRNNVEFDRNLVESVRRKVKCVLLKDRLRVRELNFNRDVQVHRNQGQDQSRLHREHRHHRSHAQRMA